MLKAVKGIKESEQNEQDLSIHNQSRETYTREIRKANREDIFSKARSRFMEKAKTVGDASDACNQQEQQQRVVLLESRWRDELTEMLGSTYQMDEMSQLVSELYGQDILAIHHGVIGLRQLTWSASQKQVESMVELKVPELLVSMTRAKDQYPQICLEALKTINNLLYFNYGEVKVLLVESQILDAVSDLLSSAHDSILINSVWIIYNVSYTCESPHINSAIAHKNIHTRLQSLMQATKNQELKEVVYETLCLLCRMVTLRTTFQPMVKVIVERFVKEPLTYDLQQCLLFALFSSSKQTDTLFYYESMSYVRIIQILAEGNPPSDLVVLCLRNLGTMSSADEELTGRLVDEGVLPKLLKYMQSREKVIRREAVWVMSNIVAGSPKHSQLVFTSPTMGKLLDLLNRDDPSIRKEVLHVITNMSMFNSAELPILDWLDRNHVYDSVTLMLDDEIYNYKAIKSILSCIRHLLRAGEEEASEPVSLSQTSPVNRVAMAFLSNRGIYALEQKQTNESENVAELAEKILKDYFMQYVNDEC